MMNSYTSIDLVDTHDIGYLRHSRFFKNIVKANRYTKKQLKNTIESNYQKELLKWESIVQTMLSSIVEEEKNRILKYRCERKNTYREIDFIGKFSDKKLVFCEIKLKQNYREDLNSSKLGWKQLNKSIKVAQNKYKELGGLSVCVDMSYLYGREQENQVNEYNHISEVNNYIKRSFDEKNIVWLDSQEVANFALENELVTPNEIVQIKSSFIASKNPLSQIDEASEEINNPFAVLSALH